jgi:hypothetical protein
MLCGLTIRQWSARRLDRKVTDEVNASHGAAADAGRYNKALVAKDALAGIVTAANAARSLHYARTLPWLDEGARILPAAGFEAYSNAMRDLRHAFEAAVAAFVAAYPSYVDDARLRLNGMFDPADYPDAADIADRFAFGVRILPVPDASDFRVDLADAQAAEIRAAIESAARDALANATRDAWQRVAEVTGRMVERLNAYKPGGATGRAENVFRDSLVENVRELASILPGLNLTNDPALSRIAERMESDLCQHDAADLRDSDVLRRDTAKAAAAILAEVSDFLA